MFMKKIIALGGSTSKTSINKKFAYYTASHIESSDILPLDLNDFAAPLYSIDEEIANGIPKEAKNLVKLIQNADGLVLSLAEHNGNFTAGFKNIFDWMSRYEPKVFANTPILLLSTSPGGRGGASVMSIALERFPRHGASIPSLFSLPSFQDNFVNEELTNQELQTELMNQVKLFVSSIQDQ